MRSREIHLVAYADPSGPPRPDIFKLVDVDVPAPKAGEVLIRNIWMAVDPGSRGGMTNRPGERIKLFPLNAPMNSGSLGQVLESQSPDFKAGDYVRASKGWREHFVAPAAELTKWTGDRASLKSAFGALGHSGKTAYVGLMDAGGGVKAGETVLVSAAAGSVGMFACQIAKAKGARVVGIAGTDEKCAWLKSDLGVDATINYRKASPTLSEAIKAAAPEGIDLYFENVGGEHLIAAIDNMKMYGRIVICGLIDRYSATPMAPLSNTVQILYKRLRIQGFIVGDFDRVDKQFDADMRTWLQSGAMKEFATEFDGLDKTPAAYAGLFTGANTGKTLIRLGPDSLT